VFVNGYSPSGLEKESFHIHMGTLSQNWVWDRVYFRDYLNKNSEEAKNYEKLKKILHVNMKMMEKHTQMVMNILKKLQKKQK